MFIYTNSLIYDNKMHTTLSYESRTFRAPNQTNAYLDSERQQRIHEKVQIFNLNGLKMPWHRLRDNRHMMIKQDYRIIYQINDKKLFLMAFLILVSVN